MPSKNPAQRFHDIIENLDAIEEFTAGFDLESFKKDRKTVYAVVRALEIVSEASRRLPVELHQRHPEIDWVAVASSGNVFRHEYDAVDESMIWRTVREHLTQLRKVILAELTSLG